jgi:hypothetical protein
MVVVGGYGCGGRVFLRSINRQQRVGGGEVMLMGWDTTMGGYFFWVFARRTRVCVPPPPLSITKSSPIPSPLSPQTHKQGPRRLTPPHLSVLPPSTAPTPPNHHHPRLRCRRPPHHRRVDGAMLPPPASSSLPIILLPIRGGGEGCGGGSSTGHRCGEVRA